MIASQSSNKLKSAFFIFAFMKEYMTLTFASFSHFLWKRNTKITAEILRYCFALLAGISGIFKKLPEGKSQSKSV